MLTIQSEDNKQKNCNKIEEIYCLWLEGKITTLQFCESLSIDKYYAETKDPLTRFK